MRRDKNAKDKCKLIFRRDIEEEYGITAPHWETSCGVIAGDGPGVEHGAEVIPAALHEVGQRGEQVERLSLIHI